MTYHVYLLKLENGKYFVGYCKSLKNIDSQLEKKGLKWIKTNKFVKIMKVYNNCDKYDVDKYTKKFMEVYGIDNVRGGSYYQMKLEKQVKDQILKEFTIEDDELYQEGDDTETEMNEDEMAEDSEDRLEKEFEIINKCSRCGSNDHYSYQCYVDTIDGGEIKRCRKCKEYGHLKKECPMSRQQLILKQFQKLDNKIHTFLFSEKMQV